MSNFLFILNGSTANRGCEAILLSTYDILSAAYPESRFINSSFRDDRVTTTPYLALPHLRHACHPALRSLSGVRWQVAKRLQGHQYNFERFLPWADYVFSLGGDNYSLDYGSAMQYFAANERVIASNKRLVLWGASVGPFTSDPSLERYASEHLKKVHLVVARESLTQSYLESLGIRDNVVLLPDPAFSLDPEQVSVAPEIEAILEAGALGVNLSPLLARYRPKPERWIDDAASWISAILKEIDMPILLIPHVMQQRNDDAAFMAAVMSRISPDPERLQLLPSYGLSSRQIKYVISRLRCFVGARTHATIAALSTNVPTLSIGYSVKARGINQDLLGTDHWVVDHLRLDRKLLAQKTRELLEAEDDVRESLLSRNLQYRIEPSNIKDAITDPHGAGSKQTGSTPASFAI